MLLIYRNRVSQAKCLAESRLRQMVGVVPQQLENTGSLARKVHNLVACNANFRMLLSCLEDPILKSEAAVYISLLSQLGQQSSDPEVKAYFAWLPANIQESKQEFLKTTLNLYIEDTQQLRHTPRLRR